MRESKVSQELPPIVNTSIRIDRELLAQARAQATREGRTFVDLLHDLLRAHLAKSDRKSA